MQNEQRLYERLNAFVLTHNNTPAGSEIDQLAQKEILRTKLRGKRLRLVSLSGDEGFDDECAITNIGFNYQGDKVDTVKLEVDLRWLGHRELRFIKYDPEKTEIVADMIPMDGSYGEELLQIFSGNFVSAEIGAYY